MAELGIIHLLSGFYVLSTTCYNDKFDFDK